MGTPPHPFPAAPPSHHRPIHLVHLAHAAPSAPRRVAGSPARPGAEAQAAADLHSLLTERGISGIIQQHNSTISLLSLQSDLTIWCRAGAFHWRTPAGRTVRLALADSTEACEQIICELLAGAVTADVHRFW